MLKTLEELSERVQSYQVEPDKFKSFKLKFKMMTPVCLSHPWINFDGILAHLLLRKLLEDNFYYLPSSMPIDFFELLDLPLKKLEYSSDLFIYHSSISFFEKEKIYIDKIYKRFEDRKMRFMDPGRSTKIDITRGRFKNYMINLPYLPSSEIIFFGFGDVQEIKSLLQYLPGLGKKIAAGFGFFKSFDIKEIEQDKSLINQENKAMRPIPCEFLDERKNYEKVSLSYKFPYWARGNVKLCCNVGEKIKLKPSVPSVI
jgi:CRISPR type IV-associated protein Csf3